MKVNERTKTAIMLGVLCSVAYLGVYIARNVLSAVTPAMIEGGNFTEEYIGSVSSLYFIFYAVGQLINGIVGDKIKARYMISIGLFMAGVSNFVFSLVAQNAFAATAAYAMTGFFLAMIYGPMTKVVAENTEPIHAVRCSLGYTFSSFFGSPIAGVLAMFLAWQSVFAVSSIALAVMAVVVFVFFLSFERSGRIKYNQYDVPKENKEGEKVTFAKRVKILVDHRIIKFSLVSILTGVVRTSVVFWLPTYISQALNFSSKESAGIFTAATLVISFTTFITIFIYERVFHRNMDKTLLIMFTCSALFFGGVFLIKIPLVNIILMVLAIMSANGAATILWSIYCPSLRDTGMVSGATGFLDFLSYMAAAAANIIFANAVSAIGWNKLIIVWIGLMALGVVLSLPFKKKKA